MSQLKLNHTPMGGQVREAAEKRKQELPVYADKELCPCYADNQTACLVHGPLASSERPQEPHREPPVLSEIQRLIRFKDDLKMQPTRARQGDAYLWQKDVEERLQAIEAFLDTDSWR